MLFCFLHSFPNTSPPFITIQNLRMIKLRREFQSALNFKHSRSICQAVKYWLMQFRRTRRNFVISRMNSGHQLGIYICGRIIFYEQFFIRYSDVIDTLSSRITCQMVDTGADSSSSMDLYPYSRCGGVREIDQWLSRSAKIVRAICHSRRNPASFPNRRNFKVRE